MKDGCINDKVVGGYWWMIGLNGGVLLRIIICIFMRLLRYSDIFMLVYVMFLINCSFIILYIGYFVLISYYKICIFI